MELVTVQDPGQFGSTCAEIVMRAYAEAVASRGKFVVALAGGTTPAALHRALASEPFVSSIRWDFVHAFFGDERCVPPDHALSNYGAAKRTLLDAVPIPGANVYRMEGEREPALAASAYELTFLRVCGGRVDLLCAGLGADTHVLSLHPGCPLLPTASTFVAALDSPPMNPPVSRITLTPRAVGMSRGILAMALGAEKRTAVHAALLGPTNVMAHPAHLFRKVRGLTWVLDKASMSDIGDETLSR